MSRQGRTDHISKSVSRRQSVFPLSTFLTFLRGDVKLGYMQYTQRLVTQHLAEAKKRTTLYLIINTVGVVTQSIQVQKT